MGNIIFNDGCSFSAPTRLNFNDGGHFSYCEFLPGEVYNIARGGAGIYANNIRTFLNSNWWKLHPYKKPITHFIYQVPSPTRQLLHLEIQDEEHFLAAPIWTDAKPAEFINCREKYKLKTLLERTANVTIFKHQKKYLKKALLEVENIVNLIRSYYPNVKIVFLRYEESGRLLIYEFSKDWFKDDLADFCKKNNITYIYKDNFHNQWFRKNNLTADKNHPNKAGAEYIGKTLVDMLDL